jgi:heterodisulfide reductase subunit B
MKYFYYPGCSLKGMGKSYEESLLKVCTKINLQMEEIEDWNCCGSTPYLGIDELKSMALACRNMAIAEKKGGTDIIAPCSACYLILNKTNHTLKDYPDLKEKIGEALKEIGMAYSGNLKIRHPLDVFVNDGWMEKIGASIKKPLKDLKIACYYGCQLTRPYSEFDDQINPQTMDKLIELTGAQIVDYPLKTKCCGGIITGNMTETSLELIYILLKEAKKRGADIIATPCPLCQFNLDAYQDKIEKKYEKMDIPVLYFTQIIGLAMGFSKEVLGINRCLTSARSLK